MQPAGLCEQLTPRLLAPGPAPAAAPLCQVSPPRIPCISTLPCGPGSRDPNDLAPRTTSQAGTWRGRGHSGRGRPERRWRVSPSNTHLAPRPPREPAASPWPRKAVGAQSAATGDGPRRRLAPARARQLLLGGRAPPAPVTAGGQAPGPGEQASPPRGGRLGMLRACAPQGASRLRRPLSGSGRCSRSGSRRWGADRGLLRTAAAAREGGGSRRREEGAGGGGMNHRGGRARPPSLCRSGPGGARAPTSPVASRLLRTGCEVWVTPTSPDSLGWRDPFLFLF